MAKGKRIMSEVEAKDRARKGGVQIEDKRISRGSYSIYTWGAIDCLLNHFKGYILVS